MSATGVSERILAWSGQIRQLSADIQQLDTSVVEMNSHLYPLPPADRMDAMEMVALTNHSLAPIYDAWLRLENVWKSYPETDVLARFQALYDEIKREAVPENIQKLIDQHFAVARDTSRIDALVQQARGLEERADALFTSGKLSGRELTRYVCGGMVFSLHGYKVYGDLPISGYTPLSYVGSKAQILNFPRQDLSSIAQRFIAAAYTLGYDTFAFFGTMVDGSQLRGTLGNVEGSTANASAVLSSVSLEQVKGLDLVLRKSFSGEENTRSVRIDFYKDKRRIRILNNFLLEYQPGRLYLQDIALLLDRVAESYRSQA